MNKNVLQILKWVAVAILPVIYIAFFLNSMWNPYGNLKNEPVTIVNLDTGVGDTNIGSQFTQTLIDSKQLKFKSSTNSDITVQIDNVKNGKDVAAIVIPQDFTQQILGGVQQAEIDTYTNPGMNFTAYKMISSGLESALNKLNATLAATQIGQLRGIMAQVAGGNTAALAPLADQPQIPIEQAAELGANKVKLVEHNLHPVKYNGIGMAPYMIAVSLWIMALAIILNSKTRPENKKQSALTSWGKKLIPYFLLSFVTSMLILITLSIQHSFAPDQLLMSWITMSLGALVFISLLWVLRLLFGIGGIFVGMIFMILQLASAGGAYSTIMSGKIYTALHPFLPMGQMVDGLRWAFSMNTIPSKQLLILFGWFVVLSLIIIAVYHAEKTSKKKLMFFPEEI